MTARATISDAYPLKWPDGYPRASRRTHSNFYGPALGVQRDELLRELKLLGARYVVLSTNIPTRNDGLFYANQGDPADPGIAAWFDRKGKQHVLACDRWRKVADNVRALVLTVAAMRGLERWGASDVLERTFSAFQALPPGPSDWLAVFGVDRTLTYDSRDGMLAAVKARYRELARGAHPDLHGGNDAEMVRLNLAMEAAAKELGA